MLSSLFIFTLNLSICLTLKSERSDEVKAIDKNIESIKQQLRSLERTGAEDSDKANAWSNLGMVLQLKDIRVHEGGGALQPEALEAFENALELNNNNDLRLEIIVNQHKGILLKMMGRGEEAIEAHDIVFQLSSNEFDKAAALFHKADALVMLSKVREAVDAYEESLRIQPSALANYLPLVKALREANYYTNEQWLSLIKEIEGKVKKAQSGGFDMSIYYSAVLWQGERGVPQLTSEVYWALFEAADKIGDYDRAWKNLEKAHELQKAKFDLFSRPLDASKTDGIIEIFKEGFWPDPAVGLDSKLPVFIVGMMRSGSTLTETMLDAHVNVWGMGEDSVFNPILSPFRDELVQAIQGDDDDYDDSISQRDRVKKVVSKYGHKVLRRLTALANNATENTPRKGKVTRVVDKMLFNYRNIGFIHLMFPNAVIIHTVRDPLDTILSCYKHKFDDVGLEWSLDPEHLVFEYVQYLEIIAHFRKALPGRVYDVSYEKMVKDPETTIRGVVKRLQLDWDPKVLEFYKSNRTVQTHSMQQVRHSVYSKSVGGWRRYAKHMKTIIKVFNRYMPKLRRAGALPFEKEMNWRFDPDFDYGFGPLKSEDKQAEGQGESGEVCKDSESEQCAADHGKSSKKSSFKSNSNVNKKRGSKKSKKSHKPKKTKSKSVKTSKAKQPKGMVDGVPRNAANDKFIELRKTFIKAVDPSLVQQILPLLSAKSGDAMLDELVAIGIILLNTQKVEQSLNLFQKLMAIRSDVPGAYLGYGSALGMTGQLNEAVTVFDKFLKLYPKSFDGRERRGEVLAALQRRDEALRDFQYVIDHAPTAQTLIARMGKAALLSQSNSFQAALAEYKKAQQLSSGKDSEVVSKILQGIGKCEKEMGNADSAISYLTDALRHSPSSAEIHLELAIVYIGESRWREAVPHFDAALSLVPKYKMAHGYRALMYQNLGQSKNALYDINKALEIDPKEPSPMVIGTAVLHAMGRFKEATAMYDRILTLQPSHDAWFSREVLYQIYLNLDEDLSAFNLDVVMDGRVKEGRSQRSPWTDTFPASYTSAMSIAARRKLDKEGDGVFMMTAAMRELLELTTPIAKWVQLETPGFMPNERQHRQFGLSVLQMAQSLRQHARLLRAGSEGLLVPDVAASSTSWFGFTPSVTRPEFHVFGWRDMFDIAVRWRQVSEPLDVVWWNDGLPEKEVTKQYGLRTHIVHGLNKVVRYYPYFDMAFNLTKTLMEDHFFDARDQRQQPDDAAIEALYEADDLQSLYTAAGSRTFYVVTPCYSLTRPGRYMEGTRITLMPGSPVGFDFFINSPTSSARNQLYQQDMDYTFRRFVNALGEVLSTPEGDRKASRRAFSRALEMFFYWVNYAPLSRGTSATGYAALMACVVAVGEQILSPVPRGKQLDWEGLLQPQPAAFVDRVGGWLANREPSSIPQQWLDAEPGHSLSEIFGTLRSMFVACGRLGDE